MVNGKLLMSNQFLCTRYHFFYSINGTATLILNTWMMLLMTMKFQKMTLLR